MIVSVKNLNFSFDSERLVSFYVKRGRELEIVLDAGETSFFFFFIETEPTTYTFKFPDEESCLEAYKDILSQLNCK